MIDMEFNQDYEDQVNEMYDKYNIPLNEREIKSCTYDRQTIKGVAYIPTREQYMCLSIRIFYAKKEFIKIGMSNEDAERIAKTMVG